MGSALLGNTEGLSWIASCTSKHSTKPAFSNPEATTAAFSSGDVYGKFLQQGAETYCRPHGMFGKG